MRRRTLPEPIVASQTPWSGRWSASFPRKQPRQLTPSEWAPHVRRIAVTLLLLLSLPGQAQGDSKVQDYLTSVNRLYEDLEYEQALGQIARARRLALTMAEKVELALYEGIILADMSRWEESAAAFKAALSLNPAAKLPVKVSPKVAQHLEAVRQQVQRDQALATPSGQTPTPPPSQDAARPLAEAPPPEAKIPLASPAVPAAATEVAQPDPLRPQVLIPAIGGGVLTVAGCTFWALSRKELSRLRNNAPELATLEDARSSASHGKTYQTVGVGLLGAGLASLGTAAGMYFLGTSSNQVALGLSTDGTSAFVQGVWP